MKNLTFYTNVALAVCTLMALVVFPLQVYLLVTDKAVILKVSQLSNTIDIKDIDGDRTRQEFKESERLPLKMRTFFPPSIVAKSGDRLTIHREIFGIDDVDEFLSLIQCK